MRQGECNAEKKKKLMEQGKRKWRQSREGEEEETEKIKIRSGRKRSNEHNGRDGNIIIKKKKWR